MPHAHAVLVQAPAQLGADAQQLLLVGQLEAQPLRGKRGEEIPVGLRERLGAQAVLLPPIQAVRLLAVGELGARRAADRVPDLVARVFAVLLERYNASINRGAASSVAMSVKSRASTAGFTAGWRKA